MKTLVLFLVVTVPLMAQSPDARTAAGCGPGEFKFNLKTGKSDHAISRPEPGRAALYVIQQVQQNIVCLGGCPSTVRIGVDRAWAAAVKHDSYALFSIEPGEHHLCSDWMFRDKSAIRLSATTVKAQPGVIYYYLIELSYHGPDTLVSTRRLTTLQPRK